MRRANSPGASSDPDARAGIDAFAVGVSLRAVNVDIALSAVIIALTTCACCFVALALGKRFGNVLGDKAQIVGGVVLVLIGLKAMFF